MKISQNIFLNNPNFSAKYKTQDVLRLATGYPYKGKSDLPMIKELSGIDISSDEFLKSLPKDTCYGIATTAVEILCADKICAQNSDLKEIAENYDYEYHLKHGQKAGDENFKKYLNQLGEYTEINPFVITKEEIETVYESIMKLLEKIHF